MKKLKESFTKNEMNYVLLERTDKFYMYALFSPCDKLLGYEVGKIYISHEFNNPIVKMEAVPSNNIFGTRDADMQFLGKGRKDEAYNFYKSLL